MIYGMTRMRYNCPQRLFSTILSLSSITTINSFVHVPTYSSHKVLDAKFSPAFTLLQSVSKSTTTALFSSENPNLPPISENTKRLFLVRHGEVIPPGGVYGVLYGAQDVSLSPLGEEEAKAAASYLEQFDLEYVACSPLKRAVFGAQETLKLQANKEGKELKVYQGFSEMDRGAWCGMTRDEIGLELFERFNNCDESVTPEGGESYPFLKKRVLESRDELLSEMQPGRCSAIVSHLQVTRAMLSDALEIPVDKMVDLKIATASITCIDYDVDGSNSVVHFSSFKPDVGLRASRDGGNAV